MTRPAHHLVMETKPQVEPITLHGLIDSYDECRLGIYFPTEMRVSLATERWMRHQMKEITPSWRLFYFPQILTFNGASVIIDEDCRDGEVRYVVPDHPELSKTFYFAIVGSNMPVSHE